MNKTVLQIIRFVVLVLFQVLVINHIRLGGYVHPYIYLIFINDTGQEISGRDADRCG